MQIQVNFGDVQHSDALETRVRDTVRDALEPWAQRVTRVEVHLHDENGPKAGQRDKRCMMEVRLAGLQPMVVDHTGDDHYAVIGEAADKLRRVVQRTVERKSSH